MFFKFIHTPSGIFAFLLISAVTLVNGFTDAPASISGVVSSKLWSVKKASLVCGIFNFFGVILFYTLSGRVAKGIFDSAKFGEKSIQCICASLLGVIIFSLAAWLFAMPSSETHALVSCIYGASIGSVGVGNSDFFLSSILYMILSCAISLFLSLILVIVLKNANLLYEEWEKRACILSSFMHGAQDGQKFVGLLALFSGVSSSKAYGYLSCLYVGILMLTGTMICDKKIIASLGNDIVNNSEKTAFISDFSSTLCVLLCSLRGFSVSTGNIKACSLIGAGLGENKKINYVAVVKIILVSLATFPVCTVLGFYLARLFILIF
jgi:PiT family inorganic phosphate transporter